jgi:hypothetical protein
VIVSFVLKKILGTENEILSERQKIIHSDEQILTTYNVFSHELPSRLLCLRLSDAADTTGIVRQNGIVVYLTPFAKL